MLRDPCPQVLREAKAALEGQLQAARMELTALGAKFDEAREELFVIQSAKDSDIAALRWVHECWDIDSYRDRG